MGGEDVASEVKRLTDQYLQKVDVDGGGVMWACTQCGKQGKMKHHVREHIELTTLIAYLLIVLSVTRRSRTEWHCDRTSAKITVKKIYDLKAIFFDNLFVIVVTNGFIYYILC